MLFRSTGEGAKEFFKVHEEDSEEDAEHVERPTNGKTSRNYNYDKVEKIFLGKWGGSWG